MPHPEHRFIHVGMFPGEIWVEQHAKRLDTLDDQPAEAGNNDLEVGVGLLSAIVDNVPLVAASMGMYPIADPGATEWMGHFVQDGLFWQFLAYCAGTGGSALIIGSASGVAVMGLEKIDFIWYVKRMSLLAVAGYLAGAGVYWLMFGVVV